MPTADEVAWYAAPSPSPSQEHEREREREQRNGFESRARHALAASNPFGGLPAQVQSPVATPLTGIPAAGHPASSQGPAGVARVFAGVTSPRATLRGPALTSFQVWRAVLADAVTAHPNQVVLDLSGAPDEVARPVRHALRAVAPFPHAPVIVVVDPRSVVARALARLDRRLVDPVTTLDIAAGIVTARTWVPTRARSLRPPLISPAIARAEVLGAAAAAGLLPRVDAAMSIVGELVTQALDASTDIVQLRFSSAENTLGVAVAWNHGQARPLPSDVDDTVALLDALADVHEVHQLPRHNVAWAVLHRIPAEWLVA